MIEWSVNLESFLKADFFPLQVALTGCSECNRCVWTLFMARNELWLLQICWPLKHLRLKYTTCNGFIMCLLKVWHQKSVGFILIYRMLLCQLWSNCLSVKSQRVIKQHLLHSTIIYYAIEGYWTAIKISNTDCKTVQDRPEYQFN